MIGIYGGTFNPVHYGHLRTAVEVSEFFDLDELRLVPCAQPAHRESPQVNAEFRAQMLQLAIQDIPELSCDQRELKRSGPSYSIDTLASIRSEIGDDTPLLFFMGTDAFNGLSSWYKWQSLFDYAHIVVMTRPTFQSQTIIKFFADRLVSDKQSLKSCPSGKIYFQQVTQLDISATFIRNTFAEQRTPNFLLPETVIQYIQAKQLYEA